MLTERLCGMCGCGFCQLESLEGSLFASGFLEALDTELGLKE